MLSEEEILALREYAGRIIDPVNRYLIRDAADRIAHAGEISATTEYLTYRAETLGKHFDDIVKELAKRLRVSEEKIREMYLLAAKTDYESQLRQIGRGYVPYEQNGGVQQMVRAATEMALDEFGRLTNITRTLGMTGPDGEELPLRRFYRNAMDCVYNNVSTGAMSLDTALRFACERMAGRGVTSIDYEKGKTTSLEAAVRRNLMGGLGMMSENIARHNHDTLGCNGWEMSAHAMSAPDHEPYQGRQYSDADWTELNGLPPKPGDPANQPEKLGVLKRRVGTLNCGHTACPIILGVNLPQYTKAELEEMARKNAEGVEVGGKRYTLYEASQKMRERERAIRYWKRQFDAAEGAQDEPLMEKAASRLHRAQQRYAEFSGESGLRPQSGRTYVTGHGRSAAGKAKWANRSVENKAQNLYNEAVKSAKQQIAELPKDIVPGQQNKHIPGTLEYARKAAALAEKGQYGPSRFTGTMEDAQTLLEQYAGTGVPRITNGIWRNIETVYLDTEKWGVVVNNLNGAEAPTSVFKIHYRKSGAHLVPHYPNKKEGGHETDTD